MANLWKFDRSDYLFLRVILVGAVAWPLTLVGWDLADWLRGAPLRWTAPAPGHPPAVDPASLHGATAVWGSDAEWIITHATPGQRIGALLPDLWSLAVAAVAAIMLWRLLNSLQRDVPFTRATLTAVRILGVTVVAWIVLGWVVALAAAVLVMLPLQPDSFAWSFTVGPAELALLLVALFLVALAELFRQGVALADDVAGLV